MSDQQIETIVNLNPFQQSNEKRKRCKFSSIIFQQRDEMQQLKVQQLQKVSDNDNHKTSKKLNHFQLCQQLNKLKDNLIQILGNLLQDKMNICSQIKQKQFGVESKDIKCQHFKLQSEEQEKKSEEEAIEQAVGKNKALKRQKRVNKSIIQKKVEKAQRFQVVKNAKKVKKVKKAKKMQKETKGIQGSSGRNKSKKNAKIEVQAYNISDRLFQTIQSHFA